MRKSNSLMLPAMLVVVPHPVTSVRRASVIMTSTVPSTKSEWRQVLAAGSPAALPESDDEWKRVLEPMQYAVLREEATEPRWSSDFNELKQEGVFLCAGCAQPLFVSDAKFESGSGWPSFWAPAASSAVLVRTDFKAIFPRQETVCARCNGHLGHVFDDGPPPTGKRYCMNGAALQFESGTPRSDAAIASFNRAGQAPPPLLKSVLEAKLSGLLCLGLLYSFWVNAQAESGAVWAVEALRTSDTWCFGAVNAVFGRPPGGPLTLVLAGINALTVANKFPLIREAFRVEERADGTSAEPDS